MADSRVEDKEEGTGGAACLDSSVDPVLPSADDSPGDLEGDIANDDQQRHSDVTHVAESVTQKSESQRDATVVEEQITPSSLFPASSEPCTRSKEELKTDETAAVAEAEESPAVHGEGLGPLQPLTKSTNNIAADDTTEDTTQTTTAGAPSSTSTPRAPERSDDVRESNTKPCVKSEQLQEENTTAMAEYQSHVNSSSQTSANQQQQASLSPPQQQPSPSPAPSSSSLSASTQQAQRPKPEEKALCKYRWGKVVPTNSQRVIFFCSAHPKEPLFLHWAPHNDAYFSEELHVPCGDYTGHVIVEGKTYPVEGFNVRSYTFEVDLFLKEDVIEDEVATNNSVAEELKFQQQQQQGPVDTYRDISSSALTITPAPKMEENGSTDENGIRHNSKYEDLLRQQLLHKDSADISLDSELVMSQKSDHSPNGSGTKRLTPVGDIDKEPLQDGFSCLSTGGSGDFETNQASRISERQTSQNLYSGSASELKQDYETERLSMQSSELRSGRLSAVDVPLGDSGLSKSSSDYAGSLGSGHMTSQRELYDITGDARPGSATRSSMDKRIDDVLGISGSSPSSVQQTLGRETIGDVLGSEAILSSPVLSHTSGTIRQTPDRELNLSGSAHSPARTTLQRENINSTATNLHSSQERLNSSQDRLYSSQERLYVSQQDVTSTSRGGDQRPPSGNRPGSNSRSVSQQGSRAQSYSSLTSEVELSQFLDNNSVGDHHRVPLNFDTHPNESAALPPIMRDRPTSVPAYSTQSPAAVDKRAYTPNNRNWSSMGGGDGGGGMTFDQDLRSKMMPPKYTVSSRGSSRTVTPVPGGIDREDSAKVRDLEETVATLRKLLGSREQEVHDLSAQMRDLKDINQSLRKDLDHTRSRRTPTGPEELERQYQQLLQEKEILAAEVVQLRDRLETARGTGVDSFSSSSATAMQRRLDELEAHVCDLRHSNDSTSQKLRKAEMRVKDLTQENEKLRTSGALHAHDLQDDRGSHYNDRRLQIEMQQLREDVRTLRDRNYSLQDENFKLKEGRELPRTSDIRSRDRDSLRDLASRTTPMSSSLRSDDGVYQRTTAVREESSRHTVEQSLSRHHLPHPDQLPSPGRRLDRSYGSDSFPVQQSRDITQRSLDRSFGSDHGTRDILRETSAYSRSRLENGEKDQSVDRLSKYRDFSAELRSANSGRYDVLRSRPDGEVSEKLRATDSGKYGTLSAEKLRSFDREHEREAGQSKMTMSAERLKILEEAERNRERRALGTSGTTVRRAASADGPLSSKDFYISVRNRFGRRPSVEREKLISSNSSVPSSLWSGRSTLSNYFAADDTRQRKSEANNSDDSDSTAVLMSYDAKSNTYSGQRECEKNKHVERSRSQDLYYEHSYIKEKSKEKHHGKEYRDVHRGYKETNGDDSDTATDILLSAEPTRTAGHSQMSRRHRRLSHADDASLSSLSDGEDPQDNLRRRSQSVDGKGKKNSSRYGQTSTLRPSASTEMLGGGKTVTLASGFRSVTPQPLASQHNKNAILQQQASLSCSLTQGLRPFAPRSPGDVRIDDVVKFSRQGGKLSQGTVKFVGHLPGRSDAYLGVELYKEEGKHDGTFESIRYFKCKPNKGVFVAFNKVVMAWAPN